MKRTQLKRSPAYVSFDNIDNKTEKEEITNSPQDDESFECDFFVFSNRIPSPSPLLESSISDDLHDLNDLHTFNTVNDFNELNHSNTIQHENKLSTIMNYLNENNEVNCVVNYTHQHIHYDMANENVSYDESMEFAFEF